MSRSTLGNELGELVRGVSTHVLVESPEWRPMPGVRSRIAYDHNGWPYAVAVRDVERRELVMVESWNREDLMMTAGVGACYAACLDSSAHTWEQLQTLTLQMAEELMYDRHRFTATVRMRPQLTAGPTTPPPAA